MKFFYSLAALAVAGAAALSAQAEMVDVTSQYLTNPGFDNSEEWDYNKASSVASIQDKKGTNVSGWSHEGETANMTYACVEYGTPGQLRGQGPTNTVPTSGYNGSEGGCLCITAAWSGTVKAVSNEFTLPAGKYQIKAYVFNGSSDGRSAGRSQFAWKGITTVEHTGNIGYGARKWAVETINLNLTEDETGSIVLGYTSPGGGSGASPLLCYDAVKIFKITDDLNEGKDISYFINNNDFVYGSEGWSWSGGSQNKNPKTNVSDMDSEYVSRFFEFWHGSVGQTNKVYQTVTLGKGKYSLSAKAKQNNGESGVFVYAGEELSEAVGAETTYTVDFNVYADNTPVEIGFKTTSECSGNWQMVSNFGLKYLGAADKIAMPLNVTVVDVNGEAIEGASVAVNKEGIDAVTTDAEGKATINLNDELLEDLVATVSVDGYYEKNVEIVWGAGASRDLDVTLFKEGDNLLYAALKGKVGVQEVPAGWQGFRRNGEPRATMTSANLRADGDDVLLMARWDYTWNTDDHALQARENDLYYAYKFEVPASGIYNLSLKAKVWSEYKTGKDIQLYTQFPGKCGLVVAMSQTPGYSYDNGQVAYFELPVSGEGVGSAGEWNQRGAKFYLEKGTYYFEFSGSRALIPVKNLSLTLDEHKSFHHYAEAEIVAHWDDADENYETVFGGTRLEKFNEDDELFYIYQKEGDNSIQLYAPYNGRNFTEDGTLYLTHRVNGVNSQVAVQNFKYKAPELPEGHLLINGERNLNDTFQAPDANSCTVSFNPGTTPFDIYYKFEATKIENQTNPEARLVEDNNHDGYTLHELGNEITVNEAGTLYYYPAYNGVKGEVKSVKFDVATGVAEIEAAGAEAVYYDLNGMRVNGKMAPGVYVKRQAGKTVKVLVK